MPDYIYINIFVAVLGERGIACDLCQRHFVSRDDKGPSTVLSLGGRVSNDYLKRATTATILSKEL